MNIAISAQGKNLDAEVEPRFGRCPQFVLVNPDTMQVEVVKNTDSAASGGAGIQTAQMLASKDVHVVLTGNCGPNVFKTLQAAKIVVYTGTSGAVRQAIEQYQQGRLQPAEQANVSGHN